MSLLRAGDLRIWDSKLFIDICEDWRAHSEEEGRTDGKVCEVVKANDNVMKRLRPDLYCDRVHRKGGCKRVNCRFAPCVFVNSVELSS